jgi:hypothetical protein
VSERQTFQLADAMSMSSEGVNKISREQIKSFENTGQILRYSTSSSDNDCTQ